MKPEQKQLLRKHGEHFQEMSSYVRDINPDELFELYEACKAANSGNIGWDCYEAAQFLMKEIESLQRHRQRLAVENANRVSRPVRASEEK